MNVPVAIEDGATIMPGPVVNMIGNSFHGCFSVKTTVDGSGDWMSATVAFHTCECVAFLSR